MKAQHLLLPLSILFLSCTMARGAVPYKQRPFLAEYKVTIPMLLASSRLRIAYDGNGHARFEECEVRALFHKSENSHISFLDFNTNTSRRLIQAEHRIAREIPGELGCNFIFPKAILAQYTTEPLGPRTIRSHHCHGWRYHDEGRSEIWLDDELGIPVLKKDSPDKSAEWVSGPMFTRLVKYSSSPSPEEFTIPPEYSEKAK